MKARGCLIAIGVVLALVGAVAAVFGPGALRRARSMYAPISRMKVEQREFEAWARQRAWSEPKAPELSPQKLDAFLALRRDLHALEDKGTELRRRAPADGQRTRIEDVPAIVEGVGGVLRERFAAFRRHDIVPAEYDYLEHLVYRTWRDGLATGGDDPAARERAAREIDQAAERETAGAVRTRLQQVAAALRSRVPAAPTGIPEEVHRLLLGRATEIEAQPTGHVAARLPRSREEPPSPGPVTSP
ncbi:MAG TPA: hypothetical protein VIK51_03265 [Vicinamibacteria bacterium]